MTFEERMETLAKRQAALLRFLQLMAAKQKDLRGATSGDSLVRVGCDLEAVRDSIRYLERIATAQ
jgi:hypothetical protein